VAGDVKRWEAFLYTFSLCVLLMSQSLTILYLSDRPHPPDASTHQVMAQQPQLPEPVLAKSFEATDSVTRGEANRGRGRGRGRGK